MKREHILQHEQAVDRTVLITIDNLGGEVDFVTLLRELPLCRRDLYRSLNRQNMLGNVKRCHPGDPVALTAAARFAIAAGRLYGMKMAVAA